MRFNIGIFIGCFLSVGVTAGQMGASDRDVYQPWSFTGSLGYTWYNDAYDGGPTADPLAQAPIGDGETAFGRFAIARDIWGFQKARLGKIRFGVEVGVQSGNIIRPNIPQVSLDVIGGLYPQLNIKPMLDILGTASWKPLDAIPALALVKLGAAYRRLQINDRVTFNDLSQVGFEIQAGLGYQITNRATLSLLYQGVFNENTTYGIDPTLFIGHVSNIPSQNGLMLSLSYQI